jgi:hypothetical protein
MRIESYTVAHYGADYIGYALSSVAPFVDRMHVVYTPRPSHGHATELPCPDAREALMAEVSHLPRVRWHETDRFRDEGPQRDHALSLCEGDLALVVDCDEVWDGAALEAFLRFAWDGPQRDTLVRCRSPWRSFSWVCDDEMMPVRAIKKDGRGSAGFDGHFWHFGYAIRSEVMRYKLAIHGHKQELRPGWYGEKWEPWPPGDDLHPTCEGFWHPQPLDRDLLPPVMWRHPFWEMEPIP